MKPLKVSILAVDLLHCGHYSPNLIKAVSSGEVWKRAVFHRHHLLLPRTDSPDSIRQAFEHTAPLCYQRSQVSLSNINDCYLPTYLATCSSHLGSRYIELNVPAELCSCACYDCARPWFDQSKPALILRSPKGTDI